MPERYIAKRPSCASSESRKGTGLRALQQIAELRKRHIFGYVGEALRDDERVVEWARIRDPETKREGFVFLTDQRCLVAWRGDESPAKAIGWDEIQAWGVDKAPRRGPVLFIDANDEHHFVQMQIGTKALALGASRLVRSFAQLAPPSPARPDELERFQPHADVELSKEKLSPREMTRRALITALGVLLILGGLVFGLVPGPGGVVLVLAGLALLASEYDWAQDALDWARRKYKQATRKIRERGDVRS